MSREQAHRRPVRPRQQILVSGVGGQGVLFVSRLLAEAAIGKGLSVLTSEIHGMAQRGGTVVSHLKVGGLPGPPDPRGARRRPHRAPGGEPGSPQPVPVPCRVGRREFGIRRPEGVRLPRPRRRRRGDREGGGIPAGSEPGAPRLPPLEARIDRGRGRDLLLPGRPAAGARKAVRRKAARPRGIARGARPGNTSRKGMRWFSMLKQFPPKYVSPAALPGYQLKGLQWTVSHAFRNSPFYRKRLEEAGVAPGDIRSMDDLRRLPFTTADDLREGYPFPLLSVDPKDVVRIHSSSGTTGKRKVLCYTQKDIGDWACMFARCYEMAGLTREDRVQICVGYGLWTAGVGFQLGRGEDSGRWPSRSGPGNLDIQCTFLLDLQTTVLCCTASMGLLLAEEVHRRGIRGLLNLKKVILGAERHERGDDRDDQGPAGREGGLRHPGAHGAVRPGHGAVLPARVGDPLLGGLLHPRGARSRDAEAGRPRRDRGDGVHHAREGGGPAHPVPLQGPDAAHRGRLPLRLHPPAARQDPRALRRHDRLPGGQRLPGPARRGAVEDRRRRQRVPGAHRAAGGRQGPHDPEDRAGRPHDGKRRRPHRVRHRRGRSSTT